MRCLFRWTATQLVCLAGTGIDVRSAARSLRSNLATSRFLLLPSRPLLCRYAYSIAAATSLDKPVRHKTILEIQLQPPWDASLKAQVGGKSAERLAGRQTVEWQQGYMLAGEAVQFTCMRQWPFGTRAEQL